MCLTSFNSTHQLGWRCSHTRTRSQLAHWTKSSISNILNVLRFWVMLWWTVNVESNTHVVCKLGVKNKIMHVFIDNSEIKQHLAVYHRKQYLTAAFIETVDYNISLRQRTHKVHIQTFFHWVGATICAGPSEVPRSRLEFDDRRMCILACHSICSCKTV